MRSIPFRFDDLFSFGRTLGAADQELPLPRGERVADGEWVLAIFEIGERRRATAAAARGMDKGDGVIVLAFERRDWERLQTFAEAKSEKVKAAAPVSVERSDTADDAIPVDVDSKADLVEPTLTSMQVPPPPPAPRMGDSSPRPPRTTSSSSNMRTASGRFPATQSARVLLVDDDSDIRDVVGAMLEAVGLVVEPVTNGEEALERVRESHFDLLVLDWSLPGMTGLDLCRKIRSEEALSAIPVLFLTAHSSSKDIVDAFASGADDYVSKPFRAPELGARIFGLLRRARLAQGQT